MKLDEPRYIFMYQGSCATQVRNCCLARLS